MGELDCIIRPTVEMVDLNSARSAVPQGPSFCQTKSMNFDKTGKSRSWKSDHKVHTKLYLGMCGVCDPKEPHTFYTSSMRLSIMKPLLTYLSCDK